MDKTNVLTVSLKSCFEHLSAISDYKTFTQTLILLYMSFGFLPLETQDFNGDSNVTSGLALRDISTRLFSHGTWKYCGIRYKR